MTQIADTGIDILPIGLGCNVFGWTADEPTSFEILDAFVAGGGSFLDTSDSYSAFAPGNSGGESETVIGNWLAARGARERVVIGTKVSRHPKRRGLGAANVKAAIGESLQRLQTDHVDLYLAHYDDPDTPLEESVGAFAEIVDAGQARHVGLSNYSPARVREWIDTAQRLGVAAPVAWQPGYNLLNREPYESELAPLAQELGLAVFPYFSLAAGFLTGKYRAAQDIQGVARERMLGGYATESGFAVVAQLREIAQERDVAPASVALAWLRERPAVTAPLAGATSLDQLQPLLDAATLELSDAERTELDDVSGAFVSASN